MSKPQYKTENEFLQNYDITQYDRPSLTVDICAFSLLRNKPNANIRNVDVHGLQVLLIKRANHPFINHWALPGGFCIPTEDVKETAKRELFEETGISTASMKLINVYGKPNRDPRGWIISNTYMSLVEQDKCTLRADTDAWDAKWFAIDSIATKITNVTTNEMIHTIRLIANDNEIIEFKVRELNNTFESVDNELAFDHGSIIVESLNYLKKSVNESIYPLFDLLPNEFTLGELQAAYELITRKHEDNFRRKVANNVVNTGITSTTKGFRPAKLYRKK